MKTLGIFGDSFASLNFNKLDSLKFAWPNLIDRSTWEVNVNAMPGTSFYWTYRNFLSTHSQFDQIVCIVTKPGRVTIRDADYLSEIPFGCTGIRHCEWLLNQPTDVITPYQRKVVQSIHDYILHAQDYEYEIDANSRLLDHLRQIRPDAIFIPMSADLPNLQPPQYVMMTDFIKLILRSLNPQKLSEVFPPSVGNGGWIPPAERELIQCHMTPEVNKLFADSVENALNTGIWNPRLPETIDHQYTWKDYYDDSLMFSFLKKH